MPVLSAEEIRAGIEQVKAEYAALPQYTMFGDDNHAKRDSIVAALEWAAKEADAGTLSEVAVDDEVNAKRDEACAEVGDGEACEHPQWIAAEALEWVIGVADPPFGE